MKIVSACLAGINCRYDGQSNACPKVKKLVEDGQAIPVCPERMAGLAAPRNPVEKREDSVVTKDGQDLTEAFHKGAQDALEIALLAKCDEAILKSKSPSCGSGEVYDGTFTKTLTQGDGVFAKKLKDHGIKVKTEKEFNKE